MTVTENTEHIDGEPKKKSKLGLLLGMVVALALGAGGFIATYTGFIGGNSAPAGETVSPEAHAELPPISFIELDPLIISLGSIHKSRHLRFHGSLEVVPGHEAEVTSLLPRILDVLNSYLRAVDIEMLEDPTALIKLRAHMLRRVQLVVGDSRILDLLILEFVLN